MRMLTALVLSLGLAAAAGAQQAPGVQVPNPSAAQAATDHPPAATAPAEPAGSSVVEVERVPASAEAPSGAPEARPFPRGSFWWYVGIIVAAGVILSLIT